MSVLSPEPRKPKVLGMKPASNVVFRVYSPPRPLLPEEGGFWSPVGKPDVLHVFRDWKIQKVDFQVDGTMVLHSLVLVDSQPDLRPDAQFGDKIESWMELIAAVIDPSGHVRAESIVIGPEASESPEGGVN